MSTALADTELAVQMQSSTWTALFQASPVVQLTLAMLVVMSVVSWAIIFAKRRQFGVIKAIDEPFLNEFWKANSLDVVHSRLSQYTDSPLAHVFHLTYLELKRLAEVKWYRDEKRDERRDERRADSFDKDERGEKIDASERGDRGDRGEKAENRRPHDSQRPRLSGLDNLQRVIQKAVETEIMELESKLSFLATTGSTAPFIGLFGTVWGIMGSFHKIGLTGSASLAVVAPGIAEALIATAIGLATAIPAVMSYNHFLMLLKREELKLNSFSADLTNVIKRNFFN